MEENELAKCALNVNKSRPKIQKMLFTSSVFKENYSCCTPSNWEKQGEPPYIRCLCHLCDIIGERIVTFQNYLRTWHPPFIQEK